MRVAFLGKGGSGKTTITGAFARWLASSGFPTLAVDADMNNHLSHVLGIKNLPKPLGAHLDDITKYVKGNRKDLGSRPLLSTTPPSPHSQFIVFDKNDPFVREYGLSEQGLSFFHVGKFSEGDVGANCYHTKLHSLCVVLNHLLDTKDQFVVVDATAGVDTLSTSLLISYDLTVFVVEPTLKSISVVKDYLQTAPALAEKVVVIANKVSDEEDLSFIRSHLDEGRLIASISLSKDLRRFEQGDTEALDSFIQNQNESFTKILQKCRGSSPNRSAMFTALSAIHKKNCEWWYNDYHGERLDTGLDNTESISTLAS
jgi:CO dehydrogenase maturation factor